MNLSLFTAPVPRKKAWKTQTPVDPELHQDLLDLGDEASPSVSNSITGSYTHDLISLDFAEGVSENSNLRTENANLSGLNLEFLGASIHPNLKWPTTFQQTGMTAETTTESTVKNLDPLHPDNFFNASPLKIEHDGCTAARPECHTNELNPSEKASISLDPKLGTQTQSPQVLANLASSTLPGKTSQPVDAKNATSTTPKPSRAESIIICALPYLPIYLRMNVRFVSRAIYSAVSKDSVWTNVLRSMGVRTESHVGKVTSQNVLQAGMCGTPFKTFTRIWAFLGPKYDNLESCSFEELAALYHVDQAVHCDNNEQITLLFEKAAKKTINDFKLSIQAGNHVEARRLASALIRASLKERAIDAFVESFDFVTNATATVIHDISELEQELSTLKTQILDALKTTAAVFVKPRAAASSLVKSVLTRIVLVKARNYLKTTQDNFEMQYVEMVPKVLDIVVQFVSCLPRSLRGIGQSEILAGFAVDISTFMDHQLELFRAEGERLVESWKASVAENEHVHEQFFWSNVPKPADKTSFLTSFKRALGVGKSYVDVRSDDEMSGEATGSDSDAAVDFQKPPENVFVPELGFAQPQTEFEAQSAMMFSKLRAIETLFSLELVLQLLDFSRKAIRRMRHLMRLQDTFVKAARLQAEQIFVTLVEIVGFEHMQLGFDKAIQTLNMYDPRRYGRLVTEEIGDSEYSSKPTVEPLAIFLELVNVGDLIQQMIHMFFEEELVAYHIVDPTDFVAPSVNAQRRFEQMLDSRLAEGLNRGIDVLMDQIDFVLVTEQLGSDYCPPPGITPDLGPTPAARKVVAMCGTHIELLKGSTDKSVLDVFQQEVGMRLWHSLCKHIKKQTINVEGAATLISDVNFYYKFVLSLHQRYLYPYYEALKQVAQIYLIDSEDGKQLGLVLSDMTRFKGVIPTEELVQFVKRRKDWVLVKRRVEKVLYGFGECSIS